MVNLCPPCELVVVLEPVSIVKELCPVPEPEPQFVLVQKDIPIVRQMETCLSALVGSIASNKYCNNKPNCGE